MTRTEASRLAIILLSWNSHERTVKLIEVLIRLMPPSDRIFVVDNGSEKMFYFEDDVHLTVIRCEENLGFAGGNNVGIKRALGEGYQYALMLNTDLVISYSEIEQLLKVCDENPGAGLVGPVLQEGQTLSYGGRDIGLYLNTRLSKPSKDVSHFYIPGTVLLIRSRVFARIGWFDENYFFSGEVADFCARAFLAGEDLVIDENTLVHHDMQGDSNLRDTLYVYYNFRNRFLFVRKFHRQHRVRLFLKWIKLGAMQYGGAVKQFEFKKARAVRLAILHGLLGQYGDQHGRFI
jgi:GT2 family glycosyltransferase